jgi:prepilin-type N-terminal cleavage/methylation domain-containing protein
MENRMTKPITHKTRAFTLVELLVVVGVIAILGAILLGVVMNAKKDTARKQCAILLQALVTSIETMKADYGYTRALGMDSSGNILPSADLDKIDVGWELDPKCAFWNLPPDKNADIILNKRLKSYYEVHSGQVMGNHLVDPFGGRIRYNAVLIEQDVDGDGTIEKYVEERLESKGPNSSVADDDIVQIFPKRVFMGK